MPYNAPLDEIIQWQDSPISDDFKIADLPQNCHATVYKRSDGVWFAVITCHDDPGYPMIYDAFARLGSARIWVEDKALLLHSGKPLVPEVPVVG